MIPLAEIHFANLVPEEEKLDIPSDFSNEVLKSIILIATPAFHAFHKFFVTKWIHGAKDKVELVNLGTVENPKFIKINVDAPKSIKQAALYNTFPCIS